MRTFGYAGKILRINLSSRSTTEVSTLDYSDKFLGGRGIAAKLYWDEVPPEAGAFDEENGLIFATGPLAGIPVLGGSRWQVCGKSPAPSPEHFCYCNLGGRWGAELKFAGYDAIVVQGKSERPVYLLVNNDTAELRDASDLWGKGAIETREMLKGALGTSTRVVAIGPAGENMVTMANLLADNDASGSGGLGAVMGSKKLKAIVVKGARRGVKVAHPERLTELIQYYRGLRRMPTLLEPSGRPAVVPRTVLTGNKMKKKDPCYGCHGNCVPGEIERRIYEAEDGKKGKFMCGSAILYQPWAPAYYKEWNDVPFYATKLCDDYGLDALEIMFMIQWLSKCYKAGVLTDENTDIPISKLGSLEFIETLVRKVSLRDGFGDILAQGLTRGAESVWPRAKGHVTDYKIAMGDHVAHEPRLYITTALLHAMEPRVPLAQLHQISFVMTKWVSWAKKIEGANASSDVVRAIANRFWGSELAADFSTYEGKALAAKMIQDREYAKECLILCDFLWPISDLENTEDHIGDPTLESKILSAVTGNEVDEEGLYKIGERVFNLHRAIFVREGHRAREAVAIPDSWYTVPLERDYYNPECLMPGKDGEVIRRKGAVIDREEFEKMKEEYYQLRGWDPATGLQTRATLEELGLREVAEDLERRGLIAERT